MKAFVIRADGTSAEINPKGKKLSLEEMQAAVGGYIERVTVRGGEIYVDEDGIAKGLPLNQKASEIAGMNLRGNALVLAREARK
jgi:hypothetical protein